MLIATVALCAVLALIRSEAGKAPTEFFQSLDAEEVVKQVARDAGLEFEPGAGWGGATGSDGLSTRYRAIRLRSPSFEEVRQVVMVGLHAEVIKRLDEGAYRVIGHNKVNHKKGPDGEITELQGFGVQYKRGAVHGVFRANSFELSDGLVVLTITLDEF